MSEQKSWMLVVGDNERLGARLTQQDMLPHEHAPEHESKCQECIEEPVLGNEHH